MADLDKDGDLDLFVGAASGETYYFENIGTAAEPSFSGQSKLDPLGFSATNNHVYASPTFADIDDDGATDFTDCKGCCKRFSNDHDCIDLATEGCYEVALVGK